MYWEEEKTEQQDLDTRAVLDLVFSISCRALPVDHAYSLSQAIQQHLPWIVDEEHAGIHAIHVAESGNGWFRPDSEDQLLYPSKRTKLTLRVPKHRIDDAGQLVGKTIDIDGNALSINKVSERPLSEITTIFSRYIAAEGDMDEMAFMENVMAAMNAMNVKPKKMLCGREMQIKTPEAVLVTRSLMIAELKKEESLLLQQKGLGTRRWMGCGLFLPHKDIAEIGETMS